MSDPALLLEGVSKRYGVREANRDASLRVAPGTIHALVGENGAGKSTLLKVAYGEVRPDRGRLSLSGREVELARWSPAQAIAAGIGMVHQHFMLVPTLTVAENVVLGREPLGPLASVDLDSAVDELRRLGSELGLTVWPERRVADLSVGEQQRVEIVKVLWRGARVLLLDEPTAVLSPPEVRDFLRVLRALRDRGTTCVLCTHHLDEVAEVADAVTVLRRGAVVAELSRYQATPQLIARAMLGGDAPPPSTHERREPGDVVLATESLWVTRAGAADAVAGVSLAVRAGEILGIAGVEGNGQSELVLALAGLLKPRAGRVHLGGAEVTRLSAAARQRAGLGHVAEDRHLRGAVLSFTVADNLRLGRQRELDEKAARARATELCAAYAVEPPDPDARFAALSGGNQQKVVVARELDRRGLRALLLAQPTRGVDVGAAAQIRERIRAARAAGVAILLVSSDLGELRELADRIGVMRRGALVEVMPVAEATDERLGPLMTGAEAA